MGRGLGLSPTWSPTVTSPPRSADLPPYAGGAGRGRAARQGTSQPGHWPRAQPGPPLAATRQGLSPLFVGTWRDTAPWDTGGQRCPGGWGHPQACPHPSVSPSTSQCLVVTGVGRSTAGVAGCPQMHSPSAVSPLPAPRRAPTGRALPRPFSSGRRAGKWHPGRRHAPARMCGMAGSTGRPCRCHAGLCLQALAGSTGDRWPPRVSSPLAGLRLRAPHPMAALAPPAKPVFPKHAGASGIGQAGGCGAARRCGLPLEALVPVHSPAPSPRGSSPIPLLPVTQLMAPPDAQPRLPPWLLPATTVMQKRTWPRAGGSHSLSPGEMGGSQPAVGSPRPQRGGSRGPRRSHGSHGPAELAASGPQPRVSNPRQALGHGGGHGKMPGDPGGAQPRGAAPGPCTKGRVGAVAVGLAHGRERGRKG